jgi:uncharacterized protein (DUF2062 family)
VIGRMRRVVDILLHLEDTPHRTALAFGIGVWLAFFPIYGIHTAMALVIAFLFRLNRAALIVGAWVNNPWTVAPLYTCGTLLGCALLGVSPDGFRNIDWELHGVAFMRALVQGLRPYVWSFVLGNTILGLLAGSAAYVIMKSLLYRHGMGRPEAA